MTRSADSAGDIRNNKLSARTHATRRTSYKLLLDDGATIKLEEELKKLVMKWHEAFGMLK